MKCKKCKYEGKDFKFCPECGSKYVESNEERMDKLEESIKLLNDSIVRIEQKVSNLSHPKVIVTPTEKKDKKRFVPSNREEMWDNRLKKMLKYTRSKPNETYPLGRLYKLATKHNPSGLMYKEMNKRLDGTSFWGIRITKQGKHIRISSKKHKVVKGRKRDGYKDCLKEVFKYVKDNNLRKVNMSTAFKKLKGYNMSSYKRRYLKEALGSFSYPGVRIRRKGTRVYLSATKKIKSDKLSVRGKEVATRAVELTKEGMEKSNAWKQASEEYNKKYMLRDKPLLPVDSDTMKIRMAENNKPRFPNIENLQNKYVPALINMLKKVVMEGSALGVVDAMALGIMKGRDFNEFMSNMAFKQVEIAKYMGVENKFKFVGGGQERKLVYDTNK